MIVEDFLKTITEEISDMISSKTVIGEHIIVEDKTIIPVTKVTFGFGSGGGEGKGKSGEGGTGGGGGGGGSISPVAFLVVTAQDVQLFTVKGKGALAQLAEVMPEMMETCKSIITAIALLLVPVKVNLESSRSAGIMHARFNISWLLFYMRYSVKRVSSRFLGDTR